MRIKKRRIIVLGGDGYLGWTTAMDLAAKGHDVFVVDNYLKRSLVTEVDSEPLFKTPKLADRVRLFNRLTSKSISYEIRDCAIENGLDDIFTDFSPDTVIHFAELPSAPYSMIGPKEASLTLTNNIKSTFNLIWAVMKNAPDCHIIKLGTMGEYGTPNIDIEEGWIDIHHKGRTDTFLYPRQSGSLYHTSKIMDTDLLWFYVRLYGLRVTDLMQGPVYGFLTDQSQLCDELLPAFHYDDIFGTVLNRFIVQAIAEIPLTVYGSGGQTRGYINIKDTLQCLDLAMHSPPKYGRMRILNQFTEQFTISQIAEKVVQAARLKSVRATVQHLPNPRQEAEKHYYHAAHDGYASLGLKPHFLTANELTAMMDKVAVYKTKIKQNAILPRIFWNDSEMSGERQHPMENSNAINPGNISDRTTDASKELCRYADCCLN